MDTVLSLQGICKSFGPVQVLRHVDFSVERGEVRALLGANGAGKSTLIKIIGGVISKNAGVMLLDGKEAAIASPLDAQRQGISIIHQELSVVPQLTVLENFFLGRERVKGGILNRKEMVEFYNGICRQMNFDIPHSARIRELSIAQRQMVEIMKAVSYDAELIIMDEPTSSLSEGEKQNLFGIIRDLKKRGKTVIYISHMLEEIFAVCDNVTVMLGGEMVDTSPVARLTPHRIAELMAGTTLSQQTGARSSGARYGEPPVLSVQELSRGKHFDRVSFDLHPGEVLGIAGLVGSGRSELVRAIFGADRPDGGRVLLQGRPLDIKSPADAIAGGIGLIPEDRKNQGLVLKHPIFRNAGILRLDRMKKSGMINKAMELDYALRAVEALSIKVDSVQDPVGSLSGGNQQKVVVAKWMEQELKVLIFDEPTKGIDVRAKEDIFHSVERFAARGVAVLFISSDLEEVLRVSDRIAVMHGGRLKKLLPNEGVTLSDLMSEILVTSDNGGQI